MGAFVVVTAGLVAAVAGLVFAAASGLLFEAGEVCAEARLLRVTHNKAASPRTRFRG